jgi:hypothetical protein
MCLQLPSDFAKTRRGRGRGDTGRQNSEDGPCKQALFLQVASVLAVGVVAAVVLPRRLDGEVVARCSTSISMSMYDVGTGREPTEWLAVDLDH